MRTPRMTLETPIMAQDATTDDMQWRRCEGCNGWILADTRLMERSGQISRTPAYQWALGVACGLIMWTLGVFSGLGFAFELGRRALN